MSSVAWTKRRKPSFGYRHYNPQFWGGMGGQPALFLPLMEGAGVTSRDLSPSLANGTLVSGASWATDTLGRCVLFNGSTGYIELNNACNVSGTALTIAAWIKRLDATKYSVILARSKSGVLQYQFTWIKSNEGIGNDNALRLDYWNGSANVSCDSTAVIADTGVWHHLAVTFNGVQVAFYIDGRPAGSVATSAPIVAISGTDTRIATDSPRDVNYGNFKTAGIVASSVTLNATQIAKLYQRPWAMFTRRRPRVARSTSGLLLLRRRAAA